jgi:hypothetical protein
VKIRREQMRTLVEHARETFIRAQTTRVRSAFPRETEALSPEALRSLVEDGFDRARSYGVVKEQDVELFLDCKLLLAPDFDRNARFPWAADLLNSPQRTGTEKMSVIHDHLLFRRRA